jgi:phenylacetate-CoA ligase
MHVFEDAFVMEVNDPDTLAPKPPGERGVVFITTLFKHAAPMIRYNMNDVTSWSSAACRCGTHQRSITKLYGRSDNMVKLRGVNIFPEAIGAVVSEEPRCTGEYVCILQGTAGAREDMTVMAEAVDTSLDRYSLRDELASRLKEALGVKLNVEIVDSGTLDQMTGLSQTSKIKRLIDRRVKLGDSR